MGCYYILFPGRHHIITNYQINYLNRLKQKIQQEHPAVNYVEIVWAATSANHTGTWRNPIKGVRRLGMIEYCVARANLESQVYLIDNVRPKDDFAHFLIEEIRVESQGRVAMSPNNTIVACSTPSVADMYSRLGFEIAGVELDNDGDSSVAPRPWDVVQKIIDSGEIWADSLKIVDLIYPPCFEYYKRYGLDQQIIDVYSDPLVASDDGDITDTRDYSVYRQAFEENAWRKVVDFSDYVQPGRILDIGCATGQTIKLLAEKPELFESDFYGVEVARPLFQICEQRRSAGEFGDANVYFYQRNFMQTNLFDNDYFSTIITMALTHEIESYLGREELKRFVKRVYNMVAPGGIYINYDVVGPDNLDEIVYVKFRSDDGANPPDIEFDSGDTGFTQWLRSLSTESRFRRFARDFRKTEGDQLKYQTELVNGQEFKVLRRADLYDFLAKKDYVDSWQSEMHERFCFFNHAMWVEYLEQAGFEILPASRSVTNQWLTDNRFLPSGEVYLMEGRNLVIDQTVPVTNTLLVARKPID